MRIKNLVFFHHCQFVQNYVHHFCQKIHDRLNLRKITCEIFKPRTAQNDLSEDQRGEIEIGTPVYGDLGKLLNKKSVGPTSFLGRFCPIGNKSAFSLYIFDLKKSFSKRLDKIETNIFNSEIHAHPPAFKQIPDIS